MSKLSTTVAGITLDCCIYNASGPRTGSIEALEKIGESKSGAVLSKSATKLKQDGNPLPRFVNKVALGDGYCEGSINSEGLPNAGIDYYISEDAISNIKKTGKPYIISLSGLSLDDNLEMLGKVADMEGISAIELNMACPNIPGKPIIAYDFEQMETVLKAITHHPKFKKYPLGVKLAPYFDVNLFEKAASILCKYPIGYIVSINTIGNGLFINIDNECEAIAPKNGLGGLGGGFVKHTALANVRMLYRALKEKGRSDIDIVGVGGISSGKDAFEMILCGAKAVQIGTCHWTEGASCFARIGKELEEIMTSKGYNSIEDFRGKLKPFEKPIRKPNTTTNSEVSTKDSSSSKTTIHFLIGIIVALIAVIVYLVTAQ